MLPDQFESRFGVVEGMVVDLRALPGAGGVALSTCCSKPPLVLVFVATEAVLGESHPGAAEVFAAEYRASGG